MPNKVWYEIIYPVTYFNGSTVVEGRGWISDLIPHFIIDVITYQCWDQVSLCSNTPVRDLDIHEHWYYRYLGTCYCQNTNRNTIERLFFVIIFTSAFYSRFVENSCPFIPRGHKRDIVCYSTPHCLFRNYLFHLCRRGLEVNRKGCNAW